METGRGRGGHGAGWCHRVGAGAAQRRPPGGRQSSRGGVDGAEAVGVAALPGAGLFRTGTEAAQTELPQAAGHPHAHRLPPGTSASPLPLAAAPQLAPPPLCGLQSLLLTCRPSLPGSAVPSSQCGPCPRPVIPGRQVNSARHTPSPGGGPGMAAGPPGRLVTAARQRPPPSIVTACGSACHQPGKIPEL